MQTVWPDLRFALRLLASHPVFTFGAALTLAAGIGASTAVFAVVYGVVLRPLPFVEPDRLVTMSNTIPAAGVRSFPFSQPEFFAHRADGRAFDDLAAYLPASLNLTGSGTPERVAGARVSANFFDLLGVSTAIGRTFAAGDDRPGAVCAVVARHGYWVSRFGGDVSAVGRSLTLDDNPCTLIGVLPPDFRLPATADLWVPAVFPPQAMGREGLGRQIYRVIGRMKDGDALVQAAATTDETARRFYARYPDFYSGSPWKITIAPLRDQIVGDIATTLVVLMAAVGAMLLVACANVAHLMLGRLLAREKEFAVRTVLGAGRARLAAQILTECALVSLAGGAAGLWLASRGVDLFLALGPGDVPRPESIRLDGAIMLFTLVVSLLVCLLVGLVPALRASRRSPADALRQVRGGRTPGAALLRDGLVAAQVALTLVLLVGAGLLARSLVRLTSVDPGVATDDRLTVQVSPPASRYPDAIRMSAFFHEVADRVAALPGVVSAGGVSALPLSGQDNRVAFAIERWTPEQESRATSVHYRLVTGAYFRAIGVPLVRGRSIDASDVRESPPVAVVNETFARRFWPDGDPLGHRVTFDRGDDWHTIVGVVADVKHNGLAADAEIEIFLPYEQAISVFAPVMTLVVQSALPPDALVPALRQSIGEIDPNLPLHGIRPMADVLAASLARPRFQTSLTGLFAALGLLLAALGTFSVLAQSVAERTYEIGVRVALGAGSREILALTLGRGLRVTLIGVTVGMVAAFGLSRLLRTLLFGIGPTDPLAYCAAAMIALAAALVACAIPVRRALRVDPLLALRSE
jgi:putative ABC transport system permease protein